MENSNKSGKKKIIKRSIIKLGSSYAITYPREFLISLLDEKMLNDRDSLKNVAVDCYKVDNKAILIKKHEENKQEIKKITIDIKKNKKDTFPISILENLLESCKKLNVSIIEINYDDIYYDEILQKVHNFGAISYFQNKIIINLSSIKYNLNFKNQVYGMLKNLKLILELVMNRDDNDDELIKKKIKTYLEIIGSGYNEGLRILIHRVDNYFIENTDINNIINTLGNRVLISNLKSISYSIAALSSYRKSDEIKKFTEILRIFPNVLEQEIKTLLDIEESLDINQLNSIKTNISKLKDKFSAITSDKTETVAESFIRQIINLMLVTLNDLFEISITRWIENYVEY